MTIDLIDDPIEEATVKPFGHGVACLFGLLQRIIPSDYFTVSDYADRS